MEYWKCLWVVVVAFLLGGSRWWECEGCWEHEKTALLQLKLFFSHIKDVEKYWVEGNQSWDCCEWKRVECNNSTGRVIQLFLNHTSYEDGSLSTDGYNNWYLNASLFLPFKELKSLYLSGNAIAGCVDNQGFERLSSNLDKLEFLDLSSNYFNDNILVSLSELSSLKSLNLGSNQFTSSNPTNGIQRLSKLKKLETLDLSDNTLLGNNFLPHLTGFTSLKTLYLQSCGLEGTVDMLELNALSNLEELYMSNNRVNGFVPSPDNETKLRLTNLKVLDLSWNLFNDSIFSSLTSLSNLKSLDLFGNQLEGSIDLRGLHALTNLEELDISCSFTKGAACNLPLQSLGIFTSLKILSLGGFSFIGTVTIQRWQNLTNLEELELYNSFFPSNFIQDIGTLVSLKTLHAENCEFNGSLNLHELHSLRNLEDLTISYSTVKGILCSLSLQSLEMFSSLKTLSLGGFNISMEAMTTKRWQNSTILEELIVEFSSLPSNFIQGFCELRRLQKLMIFNNILKAQLPECFSNLTSLEYLDLSDNQFFGSISVMKSLISLRELRLSNNNFQIPVSLRPLFNLSKLEIIYADNNAIYAETERYSLTPTFQLRSISLSCCGDVRLFPQFLYYQHNLEDVDLSNIYFNGEQFPNWLLENNRKLKMLYLCNNSLLAPFWLPVASHLGLLRLEVSTNSFSGNIPKEIGAKLLSLRILNMSNNYFGGSIPVSIGDMQFLGVLDLSNNKLTGGLPKHLAVGLLILDVSNNHLFGEIPRLMENLSTLLTLDLSNNRLFGGIPRWMGNMSNLQGIIMANNHLGGPIPIELCQLNSLTILDLSVNNISEIPPSCFSFSSISQVHLSRNKLQGQLANVVFNSSRLVTLDLSHNHLTGNIPNWIGRLSQLSYLLLNDNHLKGQVPVQLCKLSHLRLINLSNNNLSGTIPPCLKITTQDNVSQAYVSQASIDMAAYVVFFSTLFSIEEPIEFATKNIYYSYKGRVLTYLSGIDLSCNNLTGEIPHEVKNFQEIIVLNLSHNSLTGSIPSAISNLSQIESLDLSYNNLSGKIPSQLVGLHFLSCFSVAYNNLSGSTPDRTAQFATFENSSYLGNPFLCGTPLSKNCSTDGPLSSMPKASPDDGLIDMNVFYASFVVSYIMVPLSIAIALYVNPYWRQAWFYYIEAAITYCYYFVVDNIMRKLFH